MEVYKLHVDKKVLWYIQYFLELQTVTLSNDKTDVKWYHELVPHIPPEIKSIDFEPNKDKINFRGYIIDWKDR